MPGSDVHPHPQLLTDNNTNIMFNLFDGEAFGYIGSSAIGAKMRNGSYPSRNTSLASVRP